ncbi:MAG: putative quinol monooxygenase [bacterium]|nr:putative quinol monooxygenase [bacterium]
MISVVAKIYAKEGKEELLYPILKTLLMPTRRESGCICYELHRSLEDPKLFMFYEKWESRDHLQLHLETPHIQNAFQKATDLLAVPVKIEYFSAPE